MAGHPEGLSWCSTSTEGGRHVEGGGHWGLCGPSCPQERTCPQGWTLLATGCYLLDTQVSMHTISSTQVRTMDEASTFCSERGASLLNLTSFEQSQEVQGWWEGRGRRGQCGRQAPALWLALRRLPDDQYWSSGSLAVRQSGQWGDAATNTPAELTQWFSTENNNHGGLEDCAMVVSDPALARATQTANFRWMDIPCDTTQFPFHHDFYITMWTLCQREVDPQDPQNPPTEAVEEVGSTGCLPGYTALGSGCYIFSEQPGTMEEGREVCRRAGGYLVEVDSKEEWKLLEEEWRRVKEAARACQELPTFWLGVTDAAEEGSWRVGRSGEEVAFTAWGEGEPNNWGPGGEGTGGEPGEDCVLAGFPKPTDAFLWVDAPCGWRGGKGSLSTFPLCEQLQGEELEAWRRVGPHQPEVPELPPQASWVRVGGYTFLPTAEGVTMAEAGRLCQEAGGHLAAPSTREEWEQVREAVESAWPQPGLVSSLWELVLGVGAGEEGSPTHGWWVAATDAREEGRWRWQAGRGNLSYSPWFTGSPRNDNVFSYGGADCAIAIHKQNFLRRTPYQIALGVKEFGGKYDVGEDEGWREVVEEEGKDVGWTDVSCSATFIPGFNINLSPLCQMAN